MLSKRNTYLQARVCQIELKVVGRNSMKKISEFEKVYATPSRIKLSTSSKRKSAGIEYSNSIQLNYPGLKNTDFLNFHFLTHSLFISNLSFSNKEVYKVGTKEIPLRFSIKFTQPKGTTITLSNKTIFPISFIGTSDANSKIGFPYTLKTGL